MAAKKAKAVRDEGAAAGKKTTEPALSRGQKAAATRKANKAREAQAAPEASNDKDGEKANDGKNSDGGKAAENKKADDGKDKNSKEVGDSNGANKDKKVKAGTADRDQREVEALGAKVNKGWLADVEESDSDSQSEASMDTQNRLFSGYEKGNLKPTSGAKHREADAGRNAAAGPPPDPKKFNAPDTKAAERALADRRQQDHEQREKRQRDEDVEAALKRYTASATVERDPDERHYDTTSGGRFVKSIIGAANIVRRKLMVVQDEDFRQATMLKEGARQMAYFVLNLDSEMMAAGFGPAIRLRMSIMRDRYHEAWSKVVQQAVEAPRQVTPALLFRTSAEMSVWLELTALYAIRHSIGYQPYGALLVGLGLPADHIKTMDDDFLKGMIAHGTSRSPGSDLTQACEREVAARADVMADPAGPFALKLRMDGAREGLAPGSVAGTASTPAAPIGMATLQANASAKGGDPSPYAASWISRAEIDRGACTRAAAGA